MDESKGCAIFCQYWEQARFPFLGLCRQRLLVATGNWPLAMGPDVQGRFCWRGQVGPEWGDAGRGKEELARGKEGKADALAWTLWKGRPDEGTVLIIFPLGTLDSEKPSRERKTFLFLPKWHPPMWGHQFPREYGGPSCPVLLLVSWWLDATRYTGCLLAPLPPPAPPLLPARAHLAPGREVILPWACVAFCQEGGLPRSRRSAPTEGFCGRNWVFLCVVTIVSHPSEMLCDLQGECGLVYAWGNYLPSF